jgi:hypothetical protein
VDTIEEPDGTAWVMLTWPMLALLILLAVLVGVMLGGLIERARS